jgi:DNA-binding NarL/FixJ family response regulator
LTVSHGTSIVRAVGPRQLGGRASRVQLALARLVKERRRTKRRVLVVDDEAAVRTIVRVALEAQGWDVVEAASPADGIASALRDRPDVVLVDVTFTNDPRDGFAICRELRSQRATQHVPIILLTAQDDGESRAFGSAVGATAYMLKPVRPLDLLRMLRLVEGPTGERPALGLYLVDNGVITPDQLERALAEQRLRQGPRVPLGEILVTLGFASADAVRSALSRQRRSREAPRAGRRAVDLRVVVADDHPSVRSNLRAALAAEAGLSVVGVARDGEEALRLIRTLRPDVAVLDTNMPRRTGLEVLNVVESEVPETKVVLFTLDESIREAGLAAGARAVVMKDQPLGMLIDEVRRAASIRRRSPLGGATAVPSARKAVRRAWGVVSRQRQALATLGVLAVGYAGAFLVVEPVLGASAAVVSVIPAALAGALLGPEVGVAGALIAGGLTEALWQTTGHPSGEAILTIGGNGLGFLALIGLGAGFGVMRALRGRVDSDARAASAFAQAAIALVDGPSPQVLRLIAVGALDAVPGTAALLFLAAPTGGFEVVGACGAAQNLIGSRATGDVLTRASADGRVRISDAATTSIGVDVPRMRSAMVAPFGDPASSIAGVIVVLSARSNDYGDAHVYSLGRYSKFVQLSLLARAPIRSATGAMLDTNGDASISAD